VLSYIFGELGRGKPDSGYELVCATSVGAVNGAHLAAVADDPVAGLSRLSEVWCGLNLNDVLRFGFRQMAGLHRVILGGREARGIFDVVPLGNLVSELISWKRVARNLRSGALRGFTVTATHVATGRPVVFVDRAEGVQLPGGLPSYVEVRNERITTEHVLASGAIPLVFPPVRIHRDLYCDGGLRLNTPMAPAVHMGAHRLLVIGVSTPGGHERRVVPADRFPGAPFLLGKVLNAFLLDHVNSDLEELELVNRFLANGSKVAGPDFVERLNQLALSQGHTVRNVVRPLAIRPSVDIGSIAGDYLRQHGARFGSALGRTFIRLLDLGEGADSDLASYLLFDGEFARWLIELGRADAMARRDELEEFIWSTTETPSNSTG
jgi:NTE family protein